MKKTWPLLVLLLVNLVIFNPVWLKRQAPFPGDLLLGEYKPWSTSSYFGYTPGGIPHKAQSFDTLRQLYPWRYLAIHQFKQEQWPLWNPYNFSGAPLLANFQTAAFYPLNLLYFIFSFNLAWVIQVVLQPLLASGFFFFWARRLKISQQGALIGSIAWGYGSFMTVWLEYNTIGHVILWLPLALLAVELLWEKRSFFRVSLLIFSLTFAFLGGHFQDFMTLWAFTLFFLWTIGWKKKRSLGEILGLTLFTFFPFLFGAIQLLPGLELVFNSARVPLSHQYLVEKVLLSAKQLVFVLIPDYFGNPATRNYTLDDTYIGKVLYAGMIPLVLAVLGLKRRSEFLVKFFCLTAGLTLFLVISSPLTGFLYSLPLFSLLSPTRILFVFQFSLAVLASFGFDFWKKQGMDRRLLGVFGLFFVAAGWGWWLDKTQVNLKNLGYSLFLFSAVSVCFWLVQKRQKIAWLVLLMIMVLDLGRFFYKITPFCPFAYIFPSSPVFDFLKTKGNWRFWGYGTASIPSNYNLIFGLFSAEGYDPLYPRWYGEFIRRSEDGQAKMAIRSDAVIAPGFGRDDFARNKSRQEILRLLGVRYLLGREENQSDQTTFPPTDYKLVWQEDNWRVYEDLRVTNRAWLIESGTAEIEGYEPLSVQIRAKTAQDNLLVISDTDYPGWQARIDGREVPVTRIEGVFKGVKVLAGEHVIHFFYRPKSFWLGLRITLFCLGGWLVGLFLYIIIKKT